SVADYVARALPAGLLVALGPAKRRLDPGRLELGSADVGLASSKGACGLLQRRSRSFQLLAQFLDLSLGRMFTLGGLSELPLEPVSFPLAVRLHVLGASL